MKGNFHPKNDVTINPSGNESIRDVIDRLTMKRRHFIMTALGTSVLTIIGDISLDGFMQPAQGAAIPPGTGFAGIGFLSIPPNLYNSATKRLQKDLVSVPNGYKAEVLVAWGDPIMNSGQQWLPDASQDAAAQEKQFGMHADGMHYFPVPQERFVKERLTSPRKSKNKPSNRGLLCVNHEYTQEEILHPEGLSKVTIEKVRKSQAAHGVSVVEILKAGNGWRVQANSAYGRRITSNTEMRVSGPAAGNVLLKSKKFAILPNGSFETGMLNDGYTAYGTLNNCANGYTPWGTYLTCEENWNNYFFNYNRGVEEIPGINSSEVLVGQNRYGIPTPTPSQLTTYYRWHEVDPRFDASRNPLEPHLFGWVVEIDPYDPQSQPVKRTALGRFKHESAQVVVDDNNYVAFYMGDDERNEYIYKFVCAQPLNTESRNANRDMLDNGTLYVAKFNDNGTGEWIPLVYGQRGLTPENGFQNQAEVLIKTRQAADRVGATMMDRPEWTAVRPRIGGFNEIEIYCTLTNNSRRGATPVSLNNINGSTAAASARPPVDAANRRANNIYGHIIRWREDGRSVSATTFTWDIFVECGDKKNSANNLKGNIQGDDFGAPDGLWFDDFGRLWIQTDQAGDGQGDWVNIGGNAMFCADPNTKQIRRFLTSPTDCEVTGVITTPDGKTMFINIQHPGDSGTPDNPTKTSNWPNSQGYGPSGRPRSSTVAITRNDGGVIGGM